MAVKEGYRLQTLLELRERKREAAEQHLAECMQGLQLERERQRDLDSELEGMVSRREARMREYTERTMHGEMSAQGAVSARLFIERLREQEEAQKNAIAGQKAVVAQKEEDLQGARANLVTATQELEAIETHEAKWAEQVKKELLAREEQALDEIAQSVFLGRER